MNGALLRSEGLRKRYGRREVVRGVSVHVSPGEVVGLLGRNGAGKTTSFRMMVGMVRPNAGHVFLNGRDVTKLPVFKRARLGMGYLSQEPSIFRRLTVRENLMAVLEFIEKNRKERHARAEAAMEEFEITHVRDNRAGNLSGGERRRLEIARALLTRPKVMLLDEPFSGVDPIAVAEIQGIVRGLKDQKIGVLLTDHNVRETLAITDRAYIIQEGEILREGTPPEILADPAVRASYLGEGFTL